VPQPRSTPIPATRTALAGLSALLVVGVILGTTLATVEPGFRDAGRESHRDLTPARQFKASLAKAVRQLVGDHHKPAILERNALAARAGTEVQTPSISGEPKSVPSTLVRVELLNLPPPASLA
jgi:hypothetical protein